MPHHALEPVVDSALFQFLKRSPNQLECPWIQFLAFVGRFRIPVKSDGGATDGGLDDRQGGIVMFFEKPRKRQFGAKRTERLQRTPAFERILTGGSKSAVENIGLRCARSFEHREIVNPLRSGIGTLHVRLPRKDEDLDGLRWIRRRGQQ